MNGDFVNLLERLVNAGVEFVLIGGFSGVVHGCTYVTQDIDICCSFSPANLLALQEALVEVHPVHRMTPGRRKLELTEENCAQFENLHLDTDCGPLDCLSTVAGLGDYDQAKRASEIVRADETPIHTLTLDALIKSRQAMNRPRDQEVLLQLQAIKRLHDNRYRAANSKPDTNDSRVGP